MNFKTQMAVKYTKNENKRINIVLIALSGIVPEIVSVSFMS
jgi:hypothetical protein